VSCDYSANLRTFKKKNFIVGWTGVMKRAGAHKSKAYLRGTGEKKGWDTLL
jgi:hypothetical protein